MAPSCCRSDTMRCCGLRTPTTDGGAGPLANGLSTATQVARGWLSLTERASRSTWPDGDRGASLVVAITAQRCELALGAIPRGCDDDRPVSGSRSAISFGWANSPRPGSPNSSTPSNSSGRAPVGTPTWRSSPLQACSWQRGSGGRDAKPSNGSSSPRGPSDRPSEPPAGVRAGAVESQLADLGPVAPGGNPDLMAGTVDRGVRRSECRTVDRVVRDPAGTVNVLLCCGSRPVIRSSSRRRPSPPVGRRPRRRAKRCGRRRPCVPTIALGGDQVSFG